ncbi:MAG: phosphoglycerate kinase [Candidatus Paceibacterota bacterium]|jgi:phosphoglycerate kinase
MDSIKKLSDLSRDSLAGKTVLLRADLNVPIVDGVVRDEYRISATIPTIRLLIDSGAKVLIISHIESGEKTLRPVVEVLKKEFPVTFLERYFTPDAHEAIARLPFGEVIVFENIRQEPGETENDDLFAKALSALADIYVNDAFAVSHREHTSVVGIPKYLPSYAGLQLVKEIEALSQAFTPEHPFLFMLGGLKFDTKMPLVEKFLNLADAVFIGGALANDIFKFQGLEVGRSVVSEKVFAFKPLMDTGKVLLPLDVVVETSSGTAVKKPAEVSSEEKIYDAGPETIEMLSKLSQSAKLIVWNGPLGDYEKGFSTGTAGLAQGIADSGAKSIIGGGDTVAVISKLGIMDKFSFVSTGGGAMLDFLANETTVGIQALKNK